MEQYGTTGAVFRALDAGECLRGNEAIGRVGIDAVRLELNGLRQNKNGLHGCCYLVFLTICRQTSHQTKNVLDSCKFTIIMHLRYDARYAR